MPSLKDRVALVTGASSGIGAACACALGAAGARVAVNYHNSDAAARKVADEIREGGGEAMIVKGDVGDPDAVTDMFTQVRDELGPLDILVANAGIQKDAPFLDLTFDDWRAVINTNLTGQFLCAQAAARQFMSRPKPKEGRARGNIIMMSSVHELIPWAGHVNYATAKGGVMMLMKTIAQELAPERIRVNGIAPGMIKTSINEDVWSDEAASRKLMDIIPYKRFGEPADVARAVLWLAGDESDYVTGHTLFVDGGMTLYPGFVDNG
jgi:glucose 1-dehydrogenase